MGQGAFRQSCQDAHGPRQRKAEKTSRRFGTNGMRCHGPCAWEGMIDEKHPGPSLPHHKLIAYQLALELVKLIGRTRISEAQLRQQARKSAASAALNAAEGAARTSLGDKSRAYGIALAEACEACAAVEIAGALGACAPAQVHEVLVLGVRLKNVLSRLIR